MKKRKIFNVILDFLARDIPIHVINIIMSLFPNHLITNRIRGKLISPFLGSCGKKLQIGRGVIINNPKNLHIADNCYISHNCYLQAKGTIMLEDSVIIGPMSVIATSKHLIKDGMVTNKGISAPIKIGKGTWCGSHVVISSNVAIGRSVIIGAGAIVTKNIEDNKMAVGVPAKPI